jgi:RHS repeat-associated protein
VVTNDIGTVVGEQRYSPYGETRFTSGTIYTDKLFTGQREITGLGIYHYNARFYSPKIGRFLSPDTIIPGYANPQNLNRFSYVLNNPLKYTDPTGHCISIDGERTCGSGNTAPRYDPPKKDKKDKDKKDDLLLSPSSFACEWFDCVLSLASVIFSFGTFPGMPVEIAGPAYILDIVVTGIAFFRTEDAYDQGKISNVNRLALNGTGIAGAFPSPFGLGLSIINFAMTLSGYPR